MRTISKLLGIFLIAISTGCGSEKTDSVAVPPVSNESSKGSTEKPPAKAEEPSLPIVKMSAGKEKFVDWGEKPEDPLEGPPDPWVWHSWFCGGPDDALRASSTLAPQGNNNYKVINLNDNDPTTAWVEGHSEYGIGEFIEFNGLMPGSDSELYILNGYQASKSSWENNSRVKHLKVSLNGKGYFIIELVDVMGSQSLVLPKDFNEALEKAPENKKLIRMTILEVYPGLKWKDTAISEIFRCKLNPN
jgi:hypothetical protein